MRRSHLHQQVKQLTTRTHHFVPSVIKKLEKKVADINNDHRKSFKPGILGSAALEVNPLNCCKDKMTRECDLSHQHLIHSKKRTEKDLW